jgi:hypothetical protein
MCAADVHGSHYQHTRGELGEDGFDIIHFVGRLLVAKGLRDITLRQPWPARGVPFNCSASLPLAPEEQGAAEDPLGGGQKRKCEVEEPLEGPGPTGGREMQQGGT